LKRGNRGLYFVGLAIRARWEREGFRQNGIVKRQNSIKKQKPVTNNEQWFSKLHAERLAGQTIEAIVLWAIETAAWKTLTRLSCRVCFPSARIRFVGPQGNDSGPTFSPALFYVGERSERFEKAFAGIGVVWEVPGVPQ